MKKIKLKKISLIFFLLLFKHHLFAQCNEETSLKNEFIVRMPIQSWQKISHEFSQSNFYTKNINKFKIFKTNSENNKTFIHFSNQNQTELGRFTGSKKELDNLAKTIPMISYEQDCKIFLQKAPNDTNYSKQYSHLRTQAPEAWNITTGRPSVVVAVIDSGIDYLHPDLKQQMWVNKSEKNGRPGIDDDQNGCVDDVYGCDLADEDGDPKPSLAPNGHHGTHVAGIIGARGNNGRGVAGVAWQIRLMAVKGFPDGQEGARLSDLIQSIYYAVNNGAKVINCSWGGNGSPSQELMAAMLFAKSKNVTVVAAAGNETSDAQFTSPASIPTVIAVGSSNSSDQLSTFSNYGHTVDLLAPGGDESFGSTGFDEGILSTLPLGRYGNLKGTSMAAPYVSGVIALMLSQNPRLNPQAILQILRKTGESLTVTVPLKPGLKFNYPRVNTFHAVRSSL